MIEFLETPDIFRLNRITPSEDVKTISKSVPNSGRSSPADPGSRPQTPTDAPTTTAMSSAKKSSPQKPPPPPPHCSQVCMTVVRNFGKYLHMMDVLHAISGEVFECMLELYYFFLDTVWLFFAKDATAYTQDVLSSKSKYAIQKLERMKEHSMNSHKSRPELLFEMAMEPPVLNVECELDSDSTLYGLAVRTTAIESLTFLGMVFRSLKHHIQRRLPGSRERFISSFYTEVLLAN